MFTQVVFLTVQNWVAVCKVPNEIGFLPIKIFQAIPELDAIKIFYKYTTQNSNSRIWEHSLTTRILFDSRTQIENCAPRWINSFTSDQKGEVGPCKFRHIIWSSKVIFIFSCFLLMENSMCLQTLIWRTCTMWRDFLPLNNWKAWISLSCQTWKKLHFL